MKITELRQKYPEYNDMSDQEFADAFHEKFYSDIPKNEFYNTLGVKAEATGNMLTGALETATSMATGAIGQIGGGLAGLGKLATTGDINEAGGTVRSVSDTLTYSPRTDVGQRYTKNVGDVFHTVEQKLGSAAPNVVAAIPFVGPDLYKELEADPNKMQLVKDVAGGVAANFLPVDIALRGAGKLSKRVPKEAPVKADPVANLDNIAPLVEEAPQLSKSAEGPGMIDHEYLAERRAQEQQAQIIEQQKAQAQAEARGIEMDAAEAARKAREVERQKLIDDVSTRQMEEARQSDIVKKAEAENHVRLLEEQAAREHLSLGENSPSVRDPRRVMETPEGLFGSLGNKADVPVPMDESLALGANKPGGRNIERAPALGTESIEAGNPDRVKIELERTRVELERQKELDDVLRKIDDVEQQLNKAKVGMGSVGGYPTVRKVPKSQRGALDFDAIAKGIGGIVKRATTPFHKLPGLKGVGESLLARYPDPNQVLQSVKQAGVNTKLLAQNWKAGMSHVYTMTKDPLFRAAADYMQTAKKRADAAVKQFVDPAQDAVIKLKRQAPKEFEQLADLFKKEMLERRTFTEAQLREAGFTERQIQAYKQTRDMFDAAYKAQNDVLTAKGLAPLTKTDYYLSSRRQGDYATYLYDKEGRLVWMLRDETARGQKQAIDWLHKSIPEIDATKTEKQVRSGRSYAQDPASSYAAMLTRFGDDPVAKKIKEALLAKDTAKDVRAFSQHQHFKRKANIRGFEGDRPWRSAMENATNLFDHQIQYAKNAFSWAELNTAASKLDPILKDVDIVKQSPDSVKFAEGYLDRYLGRGDHQLFRNAESALAHALGGSAKTVRDVTSSVKSLWVTQKMIMNTGNIIQNFWQPTNAIPYHLKLSAEGFKHNPAKTFILSTADTIGGLARHYGNRVNLDAANALSDIGKDALKYAEDNFILDLSPFDEHVDINTKQLPVAKQISDVGRAVITHSNKIPNFATFMSFVHHLDQSGKFPDRMELFREAEHYMNAAMVDPRLGERPNIIQDTGSLGIAASGLQSYFINAVNTLGSLAAYGKKTGDWKPFGATLATNTAMTGVKGAIPVMAAIGIADWLNDKTAEDAPAWNQFVPDIRKLVMDIGEGIGDDGSFARTAVEQGLPTALSGAVLDKPLDLSTRFELTPQIPGVGMAADIAKLGGQFAGGATQALGGDPVGLARMAHAVAPAGVGQGTIEALGPFTNERTGMSVSPRSMDPAVSGYKRDGKDKLYKALGIPSLEEAKTKEQAYRYSKQTANDTKVLTNLSRSIADKAVQGKPLPQLALNALFKNYPDRAGSALDAAIEKRAIEWGIPAEQRQAIKLKYLNQLEEYKNVYGSKR